jgi:hypothetical protein
VWTPGAGRRIVKRDNQQPDGGYPVRGGYPRSVP